MRKTYLSLAVSRAWSAEMPIGDPCGGPAYGERNMPLIAVAAAAYAAGTIAMVGIASMTALEIVAAVGAIASGIGVITGNEKLAKIGGIIGLAGGVGAFAQNQGWLGAAEAAKSGTEVAASASTQGAQATQVVDAAGGNIAEIAQGGADVGKAVDAASTTSNVDKIADAAQGSGIMTPPAAESLQAASPVDAAASSSSLPSGSPASDIKTTGDFARYDRANLPVDGGASPTGFLDAFNGLGKWMESNKTMATLGSQFVGGLFDDEKAAKADRYEAESDMLRQQMANMANMPVASVTGQRQPVFKTTPATYTPTGLMQKR